jgi:hypothetical protein
MVYDQNLELYSKLVKTIPEVEQKGKTVPYTSLNGNMFSYISKSGDVAIRLPKDAIEEFINKYNASLMDTYGIIQKEYVKVPQKVLENTSELKKYFELSFEFVKTLKPKATTRKK